MIRVITRNDSLLIYMPGQLVIAKYVLSLQLPSEALRHLPSPLVQNVIYTSVSFSVSEPLVYVGSLTLLGTWGSPTCICN